MSEDTAEEVVVEDDVEGLQAISDDELLIAFLHDHEEKCPVCEYNLKMLTKAVCPECGRGLTLSVGTSEPYMRPWIVLMVACTSGGALGIFWCLAILRGGLPPDNLIIPVFCQIIMLPVTVWLIKCRRSFFKIKAKTQKTIAWVGAITSFILFMWMVLMLF